MRLCLGSSLRQSSADFVVGMALKEWEVTGVGLLLEEYMGFWVSISEDLAVKALMSACTFPLWGMSFSFVWFDLAGILDEWLVLLDE